MTLWIPLQNPNEQLQVCLSVVFDGHFLGSPDAAVTPTSIFLAGMVALVAGEDASAHPHHYVRPIGEVCGLTTRQAQVSKEQQHQDQHSQMCLQHI